MLGAEMQLQQIHPRRDMSDAGRDVALQTPPHERLVQLMRRQQQRKSRERQVITLLIHMPRGIEADHGNHRAADNIGLR
jgi:hypothetical protein